MSELLDWLSRQDAPEPREVTVEGETRTVYFRKMSAGERRQYIDGLKFNLKPGDTGRVEFDLGVMEGQNMLLVQFSSCDKEGKRLFQSLEHVKKLSVPTFRALLEHAESINEDTIKDPEKS